MFGAEYGGGAAMKPPFSYGRHLIDRAWGQ
jgi:hypothetical protein